MGVFVPKTDYFCVCDLHAAVDWLKLIGQSGGPGVGGGGGGLREGVGEVSWISAGEMCSPPYVRASERDRQTETETETQRQREDAAVLVKVRCKCCLTGLKAPTNY